MSKPKTKDELIESGKKNYKTLMELIHSYSEEEQHKEFAAGTLNRNIRDVLTHLHHWHVMMLDWYDVGMRGEKPCMPTKGYTWKTLPELNKKIWSDYQDMNLETAKERLDISFRKMQTLINHHSHTELFEKKKYKWTGSTSLGVYFISNTSSHYAWAIKVIKKSMK